jgi:hypothetical protein
MLLYTNGPNYLDGIVPEDLGTDWHHLSIALNETAKWLVCSYTGGDCSTPSQAQFKDLLAASDRVAVMADVGPNESSMDTYELDNVSLTDPPQPQKKCKKKKHKRAGAAKKKKCKKKRRAKVRG